MSMKAFGALTNGAVVRTQRPRLTIDETGLATLTESYECDDSILLQSLPNINTPHPDFPSLFLKEINPEFLNLRRGRFTLSYRGLTNVVDPENDTLPSPVWSIESAAAQEDILTFKGFDNLAGTPTAPLNGALFVPALPGEEITDDNAIFVGFGPDAPDSLRGTSSFLTPSVVISVVEYVANPNGGSSVGKIDNPGGPLAGNATGGQNWLKVGFSAEQFGFVWQTRASWLRSGDNGWNPVIYG